MRTPVAAPSARLVSGHRAVLIGPPGAAGARRRGAARTLPIGRAKGVARAIRSGRGVGWRRQSVGRGSVSLDARDAGRLQRRSVSARGGRRRPVAFAGARRVCTGGGGGAV